MCSVFLCGKETKMKGTKIKIILLIKMLITCTMLLANNGTPYSFIRLNASDGLVNNQITCMFKDSRGFVWIGTPSGLSRYDGISFVNSAFRKTTRADCG